MESLIALLLVIFMLPVVLLGSSAFAYILAKKAYQQYQSQVQILYPLEVIVLEAKTRLQRLRPYEFNNNSEPFGRIDRPFRETFRTVENSIFHVENIVLELEAIDRDRIDFRLFPSFNIRIANSLNRCRKLLLEANNEVSYWESSFARLDQLQSDFVDVRELTRVRLNDVQHSLIVIILEQLQLMESIGFGGLDDIQSSIQEYVEALLTHDNQLLTQELAIDNSDSSVIEQFRVVVRGAFGAIISIEATLHEIRHYLHRLFCARNWSDLTLQYAEFCLQDLVMRFNRAIAVPLDVGDISEKIDKCTLSVLEARVRFDRGYPDDFQALSGRIWKLSSVAVGRTLAHQIILSRRIPVILSRQIPTASILQGLLDNILEARSRINEYESAYFQAVQEIQSLELHLQTNSSKLQYFDNSGNILNLSHESLEHAFKCRDDAKALVSVGDLESLHRSKDLAVNGIKMAVQSGVFADEFAEQLNSLKRWRVDYSKLMAPSIDEGLDTVHKLGVYQYDFLQKTSRQQQEWWSLLNDVKNQFLDIEQLELNFVIQSDLRVTHERMIGLNTQISALLHTLGPLKETLLEYENNERDLEQLHEGLLRLIRQINALSEAGPLNSWMNKFQELNKQIEVWNSVWPSLAGATYRTLLDRGKKLQGDLSRLNEQYYNDLNQVKASITTIRGQFGEITVWMQKRYTQIPSPSIDLTSIVREILTIQNDYANFNLKPIELEGHYQALKTELERILDIKKRLETEMHDCERKVIKSKEQIESVRAVLNSYGDYVRSQASRDTWPVIVQEQDERDVRDIQEDIKYHEQVIGELLDQNNRYTAQEVIARLDKSISELRSIRSNIYRLHSDTVKYRQALLALNSFIEDVLSGLEQQRHDISDPNSIESRNIQSRIVMLRSKIEEAKKRRYLQQAVSVLEHAKELELAMKQQVPSNNTVYDIDYRSYQGERYNVTEGSLFGSIQAQSANVDSFTQTTNDRS